ncbi:MAG: pyridoxamine 5'-phosphate oxidase [Acidobacteriota bacterium]|nr:pyridoxamine 5'-phosphate oxidase [Acidobacteriota bacterium]
MSIDEIRERYSRAGLSETDLNADPILQFEQWSQDATDAGVFEPGAACLATASRQGKPSARMVLLKGVEERGFIFFTNYGSPKARDLADNPRAALVLAWVELARQVRVSGSVERISREASARYFESRPAGSRLSAWASHQSQVIEDRRVLEERMQGFQARFGDGDIPLPPFWGGYCLSPDQIEFWQGRPDRLNDRLRYRRQAESQWVVERLEP